MTAPAWWKLARCRCHPSHTDPTTCPAYGRQDDADALDALDCDHDPRPYDELLRAGLCLRCRRPVRPVDYGTGWTHQR